MAQKPTEYQNLIRQCRTRKRAPMSPEQQLDALLVTKQRLEKERSVKAGRADSAAAALSDLRGQFRDELAPVFSDLQSKYESAGVDMAMDAEPFLSGGTELLIEVAYGDYGLRMAGTATRDGIAFRESQFANDVSGVATTGPMLRARTLTGVVFREFLCERISQLVRSAMRRQQANQA